MQLLTYATVAGYVTAVVCTRHVSYKHARSTSGVYSRNQRPYSALDYWSLLRNKDLALTAFVEVLYLDEVLILSKTRLRHFPPVQPRVQLMQISKHVQCNRKFYLA